MWAEKGVNLDSAQKLIEIALKEDPENGAYLDSYGWVMFKRGRLDDAESYLRKAMQHMGNDPVVLEHLGDVLADAGRPEDALNFYRKSLDNGSDNSLVIMARVKQLEGKLSTEEKR